MSTQSLSDTILIIGSDPAGTDVLAGHLTDHGVRVLVAGDGETGIRMAGDARPALILLDTSVPDMDGFAVCRRLKADAATQDIPVIVLIAALEEKAAGFHAGAADYSIKPIQREEVVARVATHLRLQRLTREIREADARLYALIDNLPLEFWALDRSLRYTLQNAASRAHFGDVVGRRIDDLGLRPEVAALWAEQDAKVLQGEVIRGEYERMLEGERRVYKNFIAPVIVDDATVGIAGVALDVTDCARAEEERESALENLQELETIINRSPAVVFLWRAEEGWPAEYVSENVSQLGYAPADFTSGRIPYARIIHPDDRERVAAEVSRHSREGRDEFAQEYRILTASGDVLWIDDRTWIRRGPDGAITHYQGIVLDITERKTAEEALQKARSELERRVIERTAELAKINRMLSILSECNQAVVRATEEPALLQEICRIIVDVGGYPLAWIGFAEEDAARTVRPAASAGFEDGYLETVTITWADTGRGRGPTGTAIRSGRPAIASDVSTDPAFAPWRDEAVRRGYASSIALPLHGDERVFGALNINAAVPDAFHTGEVHLLEELAGDLAFGIRSLREKAERKKTEEALRESEERYRFLVEFLPDAVAVHRDGTVVYVNPAGIRLLGGKSPEDFLGRPAYQFVHPEFLNLVDEQIRRMQQEGTETPLFEQKLRTLNGRSLDVEIAASPILYQGLPSILVVFRDVTERKQAEETLRRHTRELARLHRDLASANREANLYLDILTHDIRNTENVSNLYADLLIDALEGEAVGYVKKLQRSIQKSIDILRTVSTIRRIHRAPSELKPMDLDAVIRGVIDDFPSGTFLYEETHISVLADDLLSVIFTNLIGNAVKFGGPDVTITVRVDEEDGFVRVTVADTGPGVPDEEKEAIFHRYEQQKRGVGEGLGLYLVQILVERYGGEVWVEDRVPGHPEEGAAFRFTLRTAP
ncbi:PAS domain S-box protein [Methanoculleus sp. FWC-SCC1]|uniref:histidine kinase n=1 Tax=Methanoculleus frigidifontis TaxID=2584085 RepID=A0ABT8MCX1_9EURY|nr:PAS domain S-box protein [Methanoculleus sp. FWC-SCC1]MDN7025781.1 PAS domain S-box protein [Methanoculleus sp. FWC-SCC1]